MHEVTWGVFGFDIFHLVIVTLMMFDEFKITSLLRLDLQLEIKLLYNMSSDCCTSCLAQGGVVSIRPSSSIAYSLPTFSQTFFAKAHPTDINIGEVAVLHKRN